MSAAASTRAGGEAGFSLLEALVTLFVVSILAAAGASVLSLTLNGRARFEEHTGQIADLERANAMLKTDLAQLARRDTRDALGNPRGYAFMGGSPGEPLLAFARVGRENPDGLEARGSVAYVEYALNDDALVRRMAVRADPTDDTPVLDTVLMRGVESAEVEFSSGGAWRPLAAVSADADDGGSFPEAVALTLELADGGEVRQLFLTGIES
jgi:general secretion pathway protein J